MFRPVNEDELQLYVDGGLPATRLGSVEAYLAANPEDAQRIEDYCELNEKLKALGSGIMRDLPPEGEARLRALVTAHRARQSLQAAVSLRPRAVRAWLGLGLLAQKSDDYAAAVEDYSQVVSIQNWDLGYLLLAHALEKSGRIREAEAAMEQAKRLSPNFDELRKTADALQAQ